ncbi:MAG: hypothetical protein WBD22_14795 [Pyrinomonadaceae bacterium]
MTKFSIQKNLSDGVELIRLVNELENESVSISAEFGGNINELILSKGGRPHHIMDGFRSRREFAANNGYKGVKLLPFPNRIANGTYNFEGREYRLPINESELNHAHHGFFFRLQMVETSARACDEFAELALSNDYTGDRDGYPFAFRTQITYRLDGVDKFSATTEIVNTGASPMPLGDGWHPYFQIGESTDDLTIRLPRAKKIALDERMIPMESQPNDEPLRRSMPLRDINLDSLFALDDEDEMAVTEIYHETENVTICVRQETGVGKYNFLCVYTPPHRRSIAVEPMTCAIDAFNNGRGLIVLQPGEKFAAGWGVSLS